MLTRRIRKLLRGLTVRLAAGSVHSGLCKVVSIDGVGVQMPKLKQYSTGRLFVGAISVIILGALTVQIFIRIISL